jgi:hypothetical protein
MKIKIKKRKSVSSEIEKYNLNWEEIKKEVKEKDYRLIEKNITTALMIVHKEVFYIMADAKQALMSKTIKIKVTGIVEYSGDIGDLGITITKM